MKKIVIILNDSNKSYLLNDLISAEVDPKGVSIIIARNLEPSEIKRVTRHVGSKKPHMTIYDSEMPNEKLRVIHQEVKSALIAQGIPTQFFSLGIPTTMEDLCPLTTLPAVQAFRHLDN